GGAFAPGAECHVAGAAGDLPEGVARAEVAIDSGAAKARLAALARITRGQ
ncbi:MAG TPA: anthranilate phosphoribosyltransferase, partial [Paracoccaceae bacterium]|nr:anthranilate phosphoribosyltransferase [Paracoccaceae bacterium]